MAMPKTPLLTTDCVIRDNDGRVLLIRRKNEVEAACRREVLEEAGIAVGELRLVGVYSDPSRDPRGHTVSIAYMTFLPQAPSPKAGSDAEEADWVEDWRTLELAFDHAEIIADAETLARR
jgi:8-oxo-dGTP diphosphatase